MRTTFLAIVLLATGGYPARNPSSSPPPVQVSLSVDIHQSVQTVSGEQITNFLRIGSGILQQPESQFHAFTNVQLTLMGSPQPFTHGTGEIKTCSDLKDLFGTSDVNGHPDVLIVQSIGCCDGIEEPVIGCTLPGGRIIIMDPGPSFSAQFKAVQWIHEYGHKVRLYHSSDPGAVMAKAVDKKHADITPCERDHFLGQSQQPCSSEILAPPAATNVNAFVHQIYIEGLRYEEGSFFKSSDIALLAPMLDRCDEVHYWPNIVNVLGMIGDPAAFPILKDFLESDMATKCAGAWLNSSPAGIDLAKKAVPIALGYILANQNDSNVFQYLAAAAQCQEPSNPLHHIAPHREPQMFRKADLMRTAIFGLGLSGQPTAQECLSRVSGPHAGAEEPVSKFIGEALEINQQVRAGGGGKGGLRKYYRDSAIKLLGGPL